LATVFRALDLNPEQYAKSHEAGLSAAAAAAAATAKERGLDSQDYLTLITHQPLSEELRKMLNQYSGAVTHVPGVTLEEEKGDEQHREFCLIQQREFPDEPQEFSKRKGNAARLPPHIFNCCFLENGRNYRIELLKQLRATLLLEKTQILPAVLLQMLVPFLSDGYNDARLLGMEYHRNRVRVAPDDSPIAETLFRVALRSPIPLFRASDVFYELGQLNVLSAENPELLPLHKKELLEEAEYFFIKSQSIKALFALGVLCNKEGHYDRVKILAAHLEAVTRQFPTPENLLLLAKGYSMRAVRHDLSLEARNKATILLLKRSNSYEAQLILLSERKDPARMTPDRQGRYPNMPNYGYLVPDSQIRDYYGRLPEHQYYNDPLPSDRLPDERGRAPGSFNYGRAEDDAQLPDQYNRLPGHQYYNHPWAPDRLPDAHGRWPGIFNYGRAEDNSQLPDKHGRLPGNQNHGNFLADHLIQDAHGRWPGIHHNYGNPKSDAELSAEREKNPEKESKDKT